jgi:hypothetical protein
LHETAFTGRRLCSTGDGDAEAGATRLSLPEKADDDERATRNLMRDGFYKNTKQSNEETVCR